MIKKHHNLHEKQCFPKSPLAFYSTTVFYSPDPENHCFFSVFRVFAKWGKSRENIEIWGDFPGGAPDAPGGPANSRGGARNPGGGKAPFSAKSPKKGDFPEFPKFLLTLEVFSLGTLNNMSYRGGFACNFPVFLFFSCNLLSYFSGPNSVK
jgi:hypothetical protein